MFSRNLNVGRQNNVCRKISSNGAGCHGSTQSISGVWTRTQAPTRAQTQTKAGEIFFREILIPATRSCSLRTSSHKYLHFRLENFLEMEGSFASKFFNEFTLISRFFDDLQFSLFLKHFCSNFVKGSGIEILWHRCFITLWHFLSLMLACLFNYGMSLLGTYEIQVSWTLALNDDKIDYFM